MTKSEAAIIMAYTGVVIGDFSTFHEYAEKIIGEPIWTHEFASRELKELLKEKSRDDFINLSKTITED